MNWIQEADQDRNPTTIPTEKQVFCGCNNRSLLSLNFIQLDQNVYTSCPTKPLTYMLYR